MKYGIIFFFFLWVSFFFLSCDNSRPKQKEVQTIVDSSYLKVKKRHTLIAATNFSPINYFIYRGQTLGFEYEMLRKFAKYLDVDLEIQIINDVDSAIYKVNRGEFDLIALGLTVTNDRKKKIHFSTPLLQTRQVLVQRKRPYKNTNDKYLQNPLELDGKDIHILKNQMYRTHLEHLQEDIGIHFNILEHSDFSLEELIDSVAAGKFDYAVCDEHIAKAYQKFTTHIDLKTALSLPQNIAWGLARDADSLHRHLNRWLETFQKSRIAKNIYDKYFRFPLQQYANQEFHSYKGNKISSYDAIIRKAAKKIGWDWRLLAALIYQESKFNPSAKSWVGAFGLMQLMPQTAEDLGVDSLSSEMEQIFAGVQLLKTLDKQWKTRVKDSIERVNFVLASYNVGMAHVLDARNLAQKYGKNANVWKDNVDVFLLNKSKPEFFQDPVVKYGYCRGSEPYHFVKEINARYFQYKTLISD
jgi:membrane-bound lytic murein transglycosylase F